MAQIHLHVISMDMDSTFLKKRSHWNSFTTPFLLPPRKVADLLKEKGKIKLDSSYYGKLLMNDLTCNRCSKNFGDLNNLKKHLSLCDCDFDDSFLVEQTIVDRH